MEIVMVFLYMFIFSFLYAIVKKYEIDSEYQHEFETILIYESNGTQMPQIVKIKIRRKSP